MKIQEIRTNPKNGKRYGFTKNGSKWMVRVECKNYFRGKTQTTWRVCNETMKGVDIDTAVGVYHKKLGVVSQYTKALKA